MTVRHRSIRNHSRHTVISELLFLPLYSTLLLDAILQTQFSYSQKLVPLSHATAVLGYKGGQDVEVAVHTHTRLFRLEQLNRLSIEISNLQPATGLVA